MDIKIRGAVEKDLPGVLAIYAQPDMDNGVVLDMEQAAVIFNRFKAYPSYTLYVAELDGQIVGTFALLIMDNLGHMGTPSGLMEDVVVGADCQGKGIGRQMVQFAIKVCKDHGCYKMALSSNIKREAAHRFYESIGFKRHGYSFLMDLGDND